MRWRWWIAGFLIALAAAVLFWSRRPHGSAGRASREHAARSGMPSFREGVSYDWLGQPGVAGRRIAGRVTHAGQPVAQALVRLTTEELHIGEWVLAVQVTDAAGGFDLGVQPASRFRVVASAEGYVATGALVDLRKPDPSDALVIELRDCAVVLAGTVRDVAGGVIPLARVRAGTQGDEFGTTTADAEGRYRLCASPGAIHAEASADGYGTEMVHRRGARGEERIDFVLSPEVVIAGHVVDDSGGPVEGATVLAATDGHGPGAYAETDSDGSFRLLGLAVGSYRVVARDGERLAEKGLMARPAGSTVELTLALADRAVVAGRVLADGEPVRGATVTVMSPGPGRPRPYGSAVTQDDGAFVVAGLPTKGKAEVKVQGYQLIRPTAPVELAGLSTLDLECQRLAKVSGRVVRNRLPVARAVVMLPTVATAQQQVISKPDGSFRFEGIEAGFWVLRAESTSEGAMMAERPLEVGTGDIDNLVLDLDLSSSVSGIVVDQDGAPVSDAVVDLNSANDHGSGATAQDGTFTCTTLAGGRDYSVTTRREGPGYLPLPAASGHDFPTIHVPDGRSAVTGIRLVVVRGQLTVSGKVLREGQPVAGRLVRGISAAGLGAAETHTGSDGTFVLTELSDDTYSIFPVSDGQRTTRLHKDVKVKAGAKSVVIDLAAAGTIEVELRGFGGDVQVIATNALGGSVFIYGADERFALEDLSPGDWVVTASGGGSGRATAKATVVASEVASVVLEVGPTGHIDGTVSDWRTGAPVRSGTCVWAAEDQGGNVFAKISPAGTFAGDVPSGPIRIQCSGSSARATAAHVPQIDLAPGGTGHVDIQIVVARRAEPQGIVPIWITGNPPSVMVGEGITGVVNGDHLVSVNGDPVAGLDPAAISLLLSDGGPGQPVRVVVERKGAELSFDVPLQTY